jgi:hypothetical protein
MFANKIQKEKIIKYLKEHHSNIDFACAEYSYQEIETAISQTLKECDAEIEKIENKLKELQIRRGNLK